MPDVRMNYDTMERMSKAFSAAKQQLEQTQAAAQKIAKMMEQGALQGGGGDAFMAAINGPLVKALKKLQDKLGEEAKDTHDAVRATRDGVKTARNRFTN